MDESDRSKEIRAAFTRELEGAQDTRSKLHQNFSEQGILLLGQRKKLIEIIITVSAAFIAAPAVFKVVPNTNFYHTGLILLIITIIFSLLHLREHVDADEAQSVNTRNMLVSVLNRRLIKLDEFLNKESFDYSDILEYQQYRASEDHSEEMDSSIAANQQHLESIPKKAMDYSTCLIMLLLTSGAFFVIISILFQGMPILEIILVEILLVFITSTNTANKITQLYAVVINFLKK